MSAGSAGIIACATYRYWPISRVSGTTFSGFGATGRVAETLESESDEEDDDSQDPSAMGVSSGVSRAGDVVNENHRNS